MQSRISEQEFMESYHQYGKALFRHCFFRVYDRERATDLVQEAYTRTWEYLQKGNTIENLRAFLYKVLNNLIINESKKKRAISLEMMQEAEGFDPGTDPREILHITLEAGRVKKLLEHISQKHREVIIMRYLDDLGPKDIAKITGESENVISVRLNRALKEFRNLLAEYNYGSR